MEKPNPNKQELPQEVHKTISDLLKFLEDVEEKFVETRLSPKEDINENSR